MDFNSRRRISLAVALSWMTLYSSTAVAEPRRPYRERIAWPASAVVKVQLVDVSLADAPSRTIAQPRITSHGQVPKPYQLQSDGAEIIPGRSHALQARIVVGDRLWFAHTAHHAAFAGGTETANMPFAAMAEAGAAGGPAGKWLAENIRGGGVIDRLQTILEIAVDGTVTGTGGCNRMIGRATISGENITFGSMASTKMACSPAAMDQERKFFAALEDARTWRSDPTRRKLTLFDAEGRPVIVLAQM